MEMTARDAQLPSDHGLNDEEVKCVIGHLEQWAEFASQVRKPVSLSLNGLFRSDIAALDYFVVRSRNLERSAERSGRLYRIDVWSRALQNISWCPVPQEEATGLVPFATLRTFHPTGDPFDNLWGCSWADVVMQIPSQYLAQTAAFLVSPARTLKEPAAMWRYGDVTLFHRAQATR